jgi:hypothetical protein
MLTAQITPRSPHVLTGRQRSIRRHARGLPLKHAVRSAVDVCFRFTCRTVEGKALWSETEQAWLGKNTFLHWALWLKDIDIPWAVATATGAPEDLERLREAVRKELTSYWTERMAALPRRSQPHWLPLP